MALSPEMIAMIGQRAQQYASVLPQFALGGFQFLNAIKQAKTNQRPQYGMYDIQNAQGNIDMLTNTMGLPQSALDLYYRNIGQSTNQGINAILGAGGNANQISSLVGNQNAQYENIAVADALQRKQDIGGIIGARNALVDAKDKRWQLNEFDPFKDKALAIAAMKNAGLQNIQGGFNSLYGAGANIATSQLADGITSQGLKTGTGDTMSGITTPNQGVNTNLITQQLFQDYMKNQSPQLNFGSRYGQFNFQPPQQQFMPQQQQQFAPQMNQPNYPFNPYYNNQYLMPPTNNLNYQQQFDFLFNPQPNSYGQ